MQRRNVAIGTEKNIKIENNNDEIDFREENDDDNEEEEDETSDTEALREKFQKNRIFKILKEFFTKPAVSQNNSEDKKDSDDSKNGNNSKKKESTEEKFLVSKFL